MRHRLSLAAALVAVLASVGGCRPDTQRTDSVDPNAGVRDRASWSPEMVEHLDAGNAAVRADSFDVARTHFLAATELEPDVAAGWFGLYMAERGLGNAEAAQEALDRAQDLAAGATLIHPNGEGGGG